MKYRAAALTEFNSIAEDTDLSVGCIFLSVIKRLESEGHNLSNKETLRDISDKDMYVAIEKSYKLEVDE